MKKDSAIFFITTTCILLTLLIYCFALFAPNNILNNYFNPNLPYYAAAINFSLFIILLFVKNKNKAIISAMIIHVILSILPFIGILIINILARLAVESGFSYQINRMDEIFYMNRISSILFYRLYFF